MTTTELKLGYNTDTHEETYIPVHHTLISGITRHGKSLSMQALAQRAQQEGYTILIFDVKTPRDYNNIGTDVPIYLEEHTDPTTLKGLLENQSGMGLNFQYAELIKMYEPGDTYQDILSRMEGAMDEDVHPVEEDKLRVLVHLLEDLTSELDRVELVEELELTRGEINVMDLHDVDDSIQQLAIAGSVKTILSEYQDTIVILDEAHNFIPQRKQPPARDPLVKLIREGAANSNWLWISDQTITGVDKDPLKQVGVWVLGKQREKNEAKRVLDQIPGSTSYTSSDVMTLEVGHFIVALDDAQPLVYVQPSWMDDHVASDIARGGMEVSNIETTQTEASDMTSELEQKEQELQEREERIGELEQALAAKREEIEELERKIEVLFEGDDAVQEASATGEVVGVDEEAVREIIREFVEEVEVPGEVSVDATRSKLVVRHVVEPVEVNTESLLGKVAYLYANGELPDDKWFTTGDVEDIVQSHGWSDNVRRTNVLSDLAKMGFLEMKVRSDRTRAYRVDMSPEEARERGLLVVQEEITA